MGSSQWVTVPSALGQWTTVASGFSRKIICMITMMCAAPAFAAGQRQVLNQVDQLTWLTGCWQATRGDQVIDEQWMAPRGGVMLAMSRTVRAGRATATEFVTLHIVNGRAVYEANPSGQQPTPFTATFVSADRAVFENPAHDYPKRIIYERKGDETLVASIDDGTGAKRVDYLYHRVMCR